jgi:hypothetical protein
VAPPRLPYAAGAPEEWHAAAMAVVDWAPYADEGTVCGGDSAEVQRSGELVP